MPRRSLRFLLVPAAGLAGVFAITPTTAGATTPTASVTPTRNLVDGQLVTVTVDGFTVPPYLVGAGPVVSMCRGGFTADGTTTYPTSDAAVLEAFGREWCVTIGSFTGGGEQVKQVAVRRTFTTDTGRAIDCSVSPGCTIDIGTITTTGITSVRTSVCFAPK